MTQEPANHSSASAPTAWASRALVILPCRVKDVFADPADAAWLARASLRPVVAGVPLLERLLQAIELPLPQAGRAALRLWGQSGARPDGWVAAADPVWMQAGMEKVFVHVPPPGEVEQAALATLFEDLQQTLFTDRQLTLSVVGEHGYLSGARPIPTAELPATAIDASRPDAFMPDMHDAAARDYYALCSEIEMLLHQHPLNVAREQRGQRPLNALWLWGGGNIGDTVPQSLPPVFSGDAQLKGYCLYSEAGGDDWPGSLAACVERAPDGFIAALPPMSAASLPALAAELGLLWQAPLIRRLQLLFDDLVIDVAKGLRSWLRFGGKSNLRKYLSDA